MELKIDLAYEQLFMLVKQLPNNQKIKLYKDLRNNFNSLNLKHFDRIDNLIIIN